MAAGAKFSPPFAILEGNYNNKENGTIIDDNSSLKQSNAKPPKHISVVRHSLSSALLSSSVDSDPEEGSAQSRTPTPTDETPMFLPVFRSGSCSEKGPKRYMEDEHICIDNLREHLRAPNNFPSPGAFYGVFDGHGGKDAAYFVRNNLLKYIVEDSNFPDCVEKAIKSSFAKADHVFGDDNSLDTSSGTTALTALILGRKMIIANAGDCRAVLGKRGKAIELSKDHKPSCSSERQRIERLGGVVFDGYLNGQLSVARALGDWHMKKGPRSCSFPLSSEPELHETILARGDEFLLLACDGLWDVMSSQCAITMARRELMLHNDPERCSKELVKEALKRDTCDNLTIIIVCFSTEPPQKIEVHPTRRRSISAEGLTVLKGALDNVP